MALDTIPKQEGGKLKAVASGTLPSGQPVIVNADGTVSVIAETSVSESVGTATVYKAASSIAMATAYDPVNNKVLILWSNQSASSVGTGVVGTVSGTSISFGSETVWDSGNRPEYIDATYDVSSGKIVFIYSDGNNSDYGKAVVATISGTSVSFGTPVVYQSSGSYFQSIVYDPSAEKVVIAWRDSSTATGRAAVGTVSGTSISFGSTVNFVGSDMWYNNLVYDPVNQQVVNVYLSFVSAPYAIKAVAGTVSGTSITFGSESSLNSDDTRYLTASYDENTNKIVAAYTFASVNEGAARVLTISGTSVTSGTEATWSATQVTWISSVYHPLTKKVYITFTDNGNSDYRAMIPATVSGTNVTFGSKITLLTNQSAYGSSTYDSTSKVLVHVYRGTASDYGYVSVIQTPYAETNLTSENYIGMSSGVVKTLSQSEAIGTESTFETGNVYGSSSGYHVAEKKALLMFQDQSDSGKIKGRLVTTTGTTLSYGSIVELTGQVGYPGSVVYDSVNEKLVVIFRGNTNYTYAVVATISGSSLTFGTPVVFNSATSSVREGVYDSTSGKIVVLYSAASVSYLKVGTVSGTSISFGSATSLGSGSGMYSGKLAYDPVNNKTIYVQVNDINSDGIAYVGTVSGTSISVGSPTTFNSNLASIYGAFYDAPSGKIGVIVQTGGGPGEGYVGTVSGTSISFGSGVQFQSSISQGVTGYDSRVNKFTVACRKADAPNSNSGLLRLGTISGNTFSFASPVTFNSGETALNNHGVGFDSDQGTSIISFMDGGDGDIGKAIGFQASGSYVVTAEVASGGAATVDIVGTVSTNQSGLTAGQQYYVQTDGTLGLTAASPSVLAGTAISATKLVVKT